MAKYGVIDLGTNTFHLLIAEVTDDAVNEIYRQRIFVKLAEEGISKIGDAAFERATQAIATFKKILDSNQVSEVRAFGTAGLRTASNGPTFIQSIKEKYNLEITLISGDQEARLIHKGVMRAVENLPNRSLIMDIGGGSVEFIICDNEKINWAKSFKIGVAVLYNQFHKNDPISKQEITNIHHHLKTVVTELSIQLQQYPCGILIGASGTFDVLENLLVSKKPDELFTTFPASKFRAFYNEMISSTLVERLENEDIPNDRAELIIVALVLLKHIIQLAKTEQILVSSYAMKEGILSEMYAT